jgi:alpha-galactosidase
MPRAAALIVLGLVLVLQPPARAVEPSDAEHATARRWAAAHLVATAGARLPVAFTYGGKPSGALLDSWKIGESVRTLDADRTERVVTATDPASGLEVRCVATLYRDLPAVEWVVHFRNGGLADTPILEDVQALSAGLGAGPEGRAFTLHHAEGSHERITDFQPHETPLGPGGRLTLASFGGRSSDGALPFFNLAYPGGGGAVIGVGWTGQWVATFERGGTGPVQVRAGMERTHTTLHPGESIRTPAVVLLLWDGADPLRGQNLLRRWLLAHATPTVGGKPVRPPIAATPHAVIRFEETTEANMRRAIGNIAAHKVPFDTWWIDTGWFPCGTNWARHVGNPDPDPARFPRGLKPVADVSHAANMKFLLWFEPERVMPGTWLHTHHPAWLLRPTDAMPPELKYQINDGFYLFDLGNPEALAWLERKLSGMIGEVGIDVYRNDFNMYPVFYWRNGEPADRQGMREIRYVSGLYHLFDTLRRAHPGLVVDTCASGGRRIDFEMLRRALVLTRSDYLWDPTGQQCHTFGLARWVPITGIGAASLDAYSTRSGLGSHFALAADFLCDDPAIWTAVSRIVAEVRTLAHLYTGDFYPLGPYSTANDAWMAWQFHRGDRGEGLVQAFRRQNSPVDTVTFRLRGLDPGGAYAVHDREGTTRTVSGRTLMDDGLSVRLPSKPAAAIVTYRQVGPTTPSR